MKTVLLQNGTNEENAFSNIPLSDQQIVSKYKLGTVQQRISAITQAANIKYMTAYLMKTRSDRYFRAVLAETIVRNELPTVASAILGTAKTVFELYQNYGFDGIDFGDPAPGIDDYLNSKNGFEQTGLSVQEYEPLTMTLEQVVEKLTKLTVHGIR